MLTSSCGAGIAPAAAGARYSAILPMPAERASRAVLSFDVSADGTRIDYVILELTDLACAALRAEGSYYLHRVAAPIESGRFTIDDPGVGVVTGRFVSPDEARGEAILGFDWEEGGALTDFVVRDPNAPCDLGTVQWVARAGGIPPATTPPALPAEPPAG